MILSFPRKNKIPSTESFPGSVLEKTLITAVLLFCLTGCIKGPNAQMVLAEFNKENPEATVITIDPAEGDGDSVYMRIAYTLPDMPMGKANQVDWLYQKKDEKWVRISTSEVKSR